MKSVLPAFGDAGVLVIGDIILDRYWSGLASRISPEAPVPVVKINKLEERPGGAANVAVNIAALGTKSKLIGLTGDDEASLMLREKLNQMNVECDFITVPAHPTITKLRVLSRHQQLLRLDFEGKFENINTKQLLERLRSSLPHFNALVLSDYAKGALDAITDIIKIAKKAKIPILVDPKGTDFSRYRGATLLTPNMSEFEDVVGVCSSEAEIEQKGMQLIQQYELEALLITRSEKGMTLLQKGALPFNLPTTAKEVYDVTGAGDTVIGVLSAALAAKVPLKEACYLANAAAGIVVGKLGTSAISFVELENVVRGRSNKGFGVMSKQELKIAVEQARQRGEKIVMTNGCFDILHAGHVSYLANARKLGNRLIVAVNSDQSTRRLKGSSRPINGLIQRMQVLAALESVDWVIPFDQDTPAQLITEILPDILVKGGDYRPEEIAGGKEVMAAGGEVKVLNFEADCSTTAIIEKIKKLN